jgi:hypothetical protein
MRLWQLLHWRNKQALEGLLEKSKLAQHAYEEGHKIYSKEAKVLQIELNTTYRKYKESAPISLVAYLMSQPNLDISPIWTPIIEVEVRKLQLHPFQIIWKSYIFMLVLYGDRTKAHTIIHVRNCPCALLSCAHL